MRHTTALALDLRLTALAALPLHALDWWQLALTELEPNVRALAIEREALSSDIASASPELEKLMADGDWRVRAAVVRGLSQSGPAAVETARGWLAHASPQVRTSALQVLLDQGQDRWLMDSLIG